MHYLNFLKAKETYADNTPIQAQMRYKLLKLLEETQRNCFPKIFEFGSGLGDFTQMLTKRLVFDQYFSNDYYDYKIIPKNPKVSLYCFDMKDLGSSVIYSHQFDLIASNACIQWLDFSQTIIALSKILKNNGIILLSTFGNQNLKEIREITGYGLEYQSLESIRNIICENFDLLILEEEYHSLHFNNSLDVFRHLKRSGVNSLGCTYLKKSWIKEYEIRFHNTLTYHCIFMLATHK